MFCLLSKKTINYKLITNNLKPITDNFSDFEKFVLNLGKSKNGFDFSFVHPDFEDCFTRWIKYKKDIKDNYKTQDSLEQAYKNLLKLADNNKRVAEEIVSTSIGNCYKGLFPLKNERKTVSPHQEAPR